MDFASIIGIIVGLGSLVLGYSMDDGNLKALWLLGAAIIVAGGSLGSIALSYGIHELKKMPLLFLQMFRSPKSRLSPTIDFIVSLSENARRDGLLSLERILEEEPAKKQPDPLLKKGMLMVIDGADLEQIRDLLETEIRVYEEKAKTEIATFESFAGYAPAYGMIGTIMGLIQVLANMESPQQMASSIAVAFITTLYGVIIANLICLPTSNKLKMRLKALLIEKEMIVEGVCSIRNGQNPKMLREKLSTYLQADPKPTKKPKTDGKEGKNEKKSR